MQRSEQQVLTHRNLHTWTSTTNLQYNVQSFVKVLLLILKHFLSLFWLFLWGFSSMLFKSLHYSQKIILVSLIIGVIIIYPSDKLSWAVKSCLRVKQGLEIVECFTSLSASVLIQLTMTWETSNEISLIWGTIWLQWELVWVMARHRGNSQWQDNDAAPEPDMRDCWE